MDLGLEGQVALVTGGGSGIGAACVRALVAEGAKVVVAVVSLAAAQGLADGEAALPVAADVRSPEDARRMVAAAIEHFESLSLAVNNAGIVASLRAPLHQTDIEKWRRVTAVDLEGVYLSKRAELAVMLPGPGAIVNIASSFSAVADPLGSAYVAAKSGVLGFTRAAALEYALHAIRVNAVGPGFTQTPLIAK